MLSPRAPHRTDAGIHGANDSPEGGKKDGGDPFTALDLLYQLHTTGLKLCVDVRNASAIASSTTGSSALASAPSQSSTLNSLRQQSPPPSSHPPEAPASSRSVQPHSESSRQDSQHDASCLATTPPASNGVSPLADGCAARGFESVSAILCIPLKTTSEEALMSVRLATLDSTSNGSTGCGEFALTAQSVTFLGPPQVELLDSATSATDILQQQYVPAENGDEKTKTPNPSGDRAVALTSARQGGPPAGAPHTHTSADISASADQQQQDLASNVGDSVDKEKACSFLDVVKSTQVPSSSPACPPEPSPLRTGAEHSASPSCHTTPSTSHTGARRKSSPGATPLDYPGAAQWKGTDMSLPSVSATVPPLSCGVTNEETVSSVAPGNCSAVLIKGSCGLELLVRLRRRNSESPALTERAEEGPPPGLATPAHDLPAAVVYESLKLLQFYNFRPSALLASVSGPPSASVSPSIARAVSGLQLQALNQGAPRASDINSLAGGSERAAPAVSGSPPFSQEPGPERRAFTETTDPQGRTDQANSKQNGTEPDQAPGEGRVSETCAAAETNQIAGSNTVMGLRAGSAPTSTPSTEALKQLSESQQEARGRAKANQDTPDSAIHDARCSRGCAQRFTNLAAVLRATAGLQASHDELSVRRETDGSCPVNPADARASTAAHAQGLHTSASPSETLSTDVQAREETGAAAAAGSVHSQAAPTPSSGAVLSAAAQRQTPSNQALRGGQAPQSRGGSSTPWPSVDSNEVTTASLLDSAPPAASHEAGQPLKSATEDERRHYESAPIARISPQDPVDASRHRLAAVAAAALSAAVERKQRQAQAERQLAEAAQNAFAFETQATAGGTSGVYCRGVAQRGLPPDNFLPGRASVEGQGGEGSSRGGEDSSHLPCRLSHVERHPPPSRAAPVQRPPCPVVFLGSSQTATEDMDDSQACPQAAETPEESVHSCAELGMHRVPVSLSAGRQAILSRNGTGGPLRREGDSEWASSSLWVQRGLGDLPRMPRMMSVSDAEDEGTLLDVAGCRGSQAADHRSEGEGGSRREASAHSARQTNVAHALRTSPDIVADNLRWPSVLRLRSALLGNAEQAAESAVRGRQARYAPGAQQASAFGRGELAETLYQLCRLSAGNPARGLNGTPERGFQAQDVAGLEKANTAECRTRQAPDAHLHQMPLQTKAAGASTGARPQGSALSAAPRAPVLEHLHYAQAVASLCLNPVDASALLQQLKLLLGGHALPEDPHASTAAAADQRFGVDCKSGCAAEGPTPRTLETASTGKTGKQKSTSRASAANAGLSSGVDESPTSSSASVAALAAAVAAVLEWKKSQATQSSDEKPSTAEGRRGAQGFQSRWQAAEDSKDRKDEAGSENVHRSPEATIGTQAAVNWLKEEPSVTQRGAQKHALLGTVRTLLAPSLTSNSNLAKHMPLQQTLLQLLARHRHDAEEEKKAEEDRTGLRRDSALQEALRHSPAPLENSRSACVAVVASSGLSASSQAPYRDLQTPAAPTRASRAGSGPGTAEGSSELAHGRLEADQPAPLDECKRGAAGGALLPPHAALDAASGADQEIVEATAIAVKAIGRLLTLRSSRRRASVRSAAYRTAPGAATAPERPTEDAAPELFRKQVPRWAQETLPQSHLSSLLPSAPAKELSPPQSAGAPGPVALAATLLTNEALASEGLRLLSRAAASSEAPRAHAAGPACVDSSSRDSQREKGQLRDDRLASTSLASSRASSDREDRTRAAECLSNRPGNPIPGARAASGTPTKTTGLAALRSQGLLLLQQLAKLNGLPEAARSLGPAAAKADRPFSGGSGALSPRAPNASVPASDDDSSAEGAPLQAAATRRSPAAPAPPLSAFDADEEQHTCPAPPPSPAHAPLPAPDGLLDSTILPASARLQQQTTEEDRASSPGELPEDKDEKARELAHQLLHSWQWRSGVAPPGPGDAGVLQMLLQAHESLRRSLASGRSAEARSPGHAENPSEALAASREAGASPRVSCGVARVCEPGEVARLAQAPAAAGAQGGINGSGAPHEGPAGLSGKAARARITNDKQLHGSDINTKSRSKPLNPYAVPFVPRLAVATSAVAEAPAGSPTPSNGVTSELEVRSLANASFASSVSPFQAACASSALHASNTEPGYRTSQLLDSVAPGLSGSREQQGRASTLTGQSDDQTLKLLPDAPREQSLQKRLQTAVAPRGITRPRRLSQAPFVLPEDSQAFLAALRKELASGSEPDEQQGRGALGASTVNAHTPEALGLLSRLSRRRPADMGRHWTEPEREDVHRVRTNSLIEDLLQQEGKLSAESALTQNVMRRLSLLQMKHEFKSSPYVLPFHSPACGTVAGMQGKEVAFLQSAAKNQPSKWGIQAGASESLPPEVNLADGGVHEANSRWTPEQQRMQHQSVAKTATAPGTLLASPEAPHAVPFSSERLSSTLSQARLTLLQLQHHMHAFQQHGEHRPLLQEASALERHPHSSPLPPHVTSSPPFGVHAAPAASRVERQPRGGAPHPSADTAGASRVTGKSTERLLTNSVAARRIMETVDRAALPRGHDALLTKALNRQLASGVSENRPLGSAWPNSFAGDPEVIPQPKRPSDFVRGRELLSARAIAKSAAAARGAGVGTQQGNAPCLGTGGGDQAVGLQRCASRHQSSGGTHAVERDVPAAAKVHDKPSSFANQSHFLQMALLALSRGGVSLSPALLNSLGEAAESPETLLAHLCRLTARTQAGQSVKPVAPFQTGPVVPRHGGGASSKDSHVASGPLCGQGLRKGEGRDSSPALAPLSRDISRGPAATYSKAQLLQLSHPLWRRQRKRLGARSRAENSPSSWDASEDEASRALRQTLPSIEKVNHLPEKPNPGAYHRAPLPAGAPLQGLLAGASGMLPPMRGKLPAEFEGNSQGVRDSSLRPGSLAPAAGEREASVGQLAAVEVAAEAVGRPAAKLAGDAGTGSKAAAERPEGAASCASPAEGTRGSSQPSSASSSPTKEEDPATEMPANHAGANPRSQDSSGREDREQTHGAVRLPGRRGSVPAKEKGKTQKHSRADGVGAQKATHGSNTSKRRGSAAIPTVAKSRLVASEDRHTRFGKCRSASDSARIFAEDEARNKRNHCSDKEDAKEPRNLAAVSARRGHTQEENKRLSHQLHQGGGKRPRGQKAGHSHRRSSGSSQNGASFSSSHQSNDAKTSSACEFSDVPSSVQPENAPKPQENQMRSSANGRSEVGLTEPRKGDGASAPEYQRT
ncbi:hypothetical protein BESB_052540 [Besnoitia besnoiti]|uniref:Uncharacterized protein n=1 Tax=Besnoitia besnoiti TaxID=94643 RepID=A0A2A9MIX7_BESBE|nr:hypothetical protein BESB_052540 [Besnoitia besnoiti]PFH35603.1 hypothetical protein BESB_052540 [Besnoitia besnoiti]